MNRNPSLYQPETFLSDFSLVSIVGEVPKIIAVELPPVELFFFPSETSTIGAEVFFSDFFSNFSLICAPSLLVMSPIFGALSLDSFSLLPALLLLVNLSVSFSRLDDLDEILSSLADRDLEAFGRFSSLPLGLPPREESCLLLELFLDNTH